MGNNPALSLAEIFGLFNSGAQNFGLENHAKIIIFCKDFLVIELDKKIDANKLIGLLGGTIKIGVILENKNANIEAENLIEEISIDKNKKFYFGFSAYGKINANFKQLAMEIKKELKQEDASSRWVVSREKQLSSVAVKKNKLISENGAEWCALKNQNEIFWGRTLAVQKFEDYGKRDFDRPARDARSGMIPPKLAKMMINLARSEINLKTGITLLDPFCGSGTILQEAAILGIDKLIGSDLSEKAVKDSKQNLEWLGEHKTDLLYKNSNNQLTPQPPLSGGLREFPPDKGGNGGFRGNKIGLEFNKCAVGLDLKIFNSDVKKISELIPADSVDLIVAEPYLGPPLSGQENENRINKIVQELSELYLSAFGEFKKILKKDSCICIVWPVFAIYKKNIFLPILDEVEKIGFERIEFDDNNYVNLIFDNSCKSQCENKNLVPATQSPDGRLRRSGSKGAGCLARCPAPKTPCFTKLELEYLRRSDCDDEFKNFKKTLAGNFSESGNIIYGREGQMVKREIVILKRN